MASAERRLAHLLAYFYLPSEAMAVRPANSCMNLLGEELRTLMEQVSAQTISHEAYRQGNLRLLKSLEEEIYPVLRAGCGNPMYRPTKKHYKEFPKC